MQAQQQTDTPRLRPERFTFGFLGALLLVTGLLLFFLWFSLPPVSRTELGSLSLLIYLLITVIPALLAFLWSARATVIVEGEGLRWRFLGRWHSAAWEEIADYFLCLNQSEGRPASWIRFRDGRELRLTEFYWGEQSAFRARVAERASNAKPSGWLLRGPEGTITGRHVFGYRRRPEYFEADEHGLVYFDGHMQHEAAWSDVLSLHDPQVVFQRARYTLETREWSAVFSSSLQQNTLLRAMVRQYAPQASFARLRTPRQELLVPTERSDGTRTFHYQTRKNRNALTFWFSTGLVFLGFALAMLVYTRQAIPELMGAAIFGPLFFGSLCFLGWGLGFWHYKTARIVVDRELVTQYRFFRKTRVFFEEIQELETLRYSDALVTRAGERPISWGHSLANVAELRQEIQKRLKGGTVQ